MKSLRDQSGFGWDEGKQRVTAPDAVWEPLIEVRRAWNIPTYTLLITMFITSILQAKSPLVKWKEKSFPLFDEMAKLCRDVIATGDNVFRTRTPAESSQGSAFMENLEGSEGGNRNYSDIEEVSQKVRHVLAMYRVLLTSSLLKPETPAVKKRPYQATSPEPSARKKRNSRASGANGIANLADTISKVSAHFGSPEGDLEASPLRCTRAYQVAEEEEGLSDHELVTVMKVFQNSTTHADAYLAFKRKGARRLWLQGVMDEMTTD